MGTSTVKYNSSLSKKTKTKIKDEKTTTKKLGFRISGYVIKDKDNNIVEQEYKPKEKLKDEHIPTIFEKMLKSGSRDEINQEAL